MQSIQRRHWGSKRVEYSWQPDGPGRGPRGVGLIDQFECWRHGKGVEDLWESCGGGCIEDNWDLNDAGSGHCEGDHGRCCHVDEVGGHCHWGGALVAGAEKDDAGVRRDFEAEPFEVGEVKGVVFEEEWCEGVVGGFRGESVFDEQGAGTHPCHGRLGWE